MKLSMEIIKTCSLKEIQDTIELILLKKLCDLAVTRSYFEQNKFVPF